MLLHYGHQLEIMPKTVVIFTVMSEVYEIYFHLQNYNIIVPRYQPRHQ